MLITNIHISGKYTRGELEGLIREKFHEVGNSLGSSSNEDFSKHFGNKLDDPEIDIDFLLIVYKANK